MIRIFSFLTAALLSFTLYAQVEPGIKNTTDSYSVTKILAEQGDAHAQYNLGVMFHSGKSVRKNIKTAIEWFGKACDNQSLLGCESYAEFMP